MVRVIMEDAVFPSTTPAGCTSKELEAISVAAKAIFKSVVQVRVSFCEAFGTRRCVPKLAKLFL